jgi:hypothetical protein
VNDAGGVRRVWRICDFDREGEQSLNGKRLASDVCIERFTIQQFHGDELLVLGPVNLVDGANARMVQRRRSAGFALKAFQGLRIARNIRGQELEGDVAAKVEVFSLIHYAHPAAPSFCRMR